MRHNLVMAVGNVGLLAVVLLLLSGPLLLGQLLGGAQSGALGVTSSRSSGLALEVTPNTTTFNQYAQFNPSPVVEPTFYQTSVTLTSFAGQEALYDGLLSVYNSSSDPITVVAEGGTLSGEMSQSKIWVTLAPEGTTAETLLTEAAASGSTVLTVADAHSFRSGQVVVNGQPLVATGAGPNQIRLSTPLSASVAVGAKVYLGAVYYAAAAQAVPSATQSVVLAPKSRAKISVTVDGGAATQQQFVMPLVIRAQ